MGGWTRECLVILSRPGGRPFKIRERGEEKWDIHNTGYSQSNSPADDLEEFIPHVVLAANLYEIVIAGKHADDSAEDLSNAALPMSGIMANGSRMKTKLFWTQN